MIALYVLGLLVYLGIGWGFWMYEFEDHNQPPKWLLALSVVAWPLLLATSAAYTIRRRVR